MNMELITQEVLRYMGVPKGKGEQTLQDEIQSFYNSLEDKAIPKWTKQLNHIDIQGTTISFRESGLVVCSRDLARVLRNSKQCYMLAVTLGVGADILIRQKQSISMAEAVIVDACASVYVEQVCDTVESEIMLELGDKEYMTMRYSPGYGDVALDIQKDLLTILQAPKRIGLNLSRSGMLVPTKSVTAFIGISNKKENRLKTCGTCMLHKSCMYRRRGERCGN